MITQMSNLSARFVANMHCTRQLMLSLVLLISGSVSLNGSPAQADPTRDTSLIKMRQNTAPHAEAFKTTTNTQSSATVAVATNFLATAEKLVTAYASIAPGRIKLISGSSGKLYAQIMQGAPIDVFLSADRERPLRLIEAGLAITETQFTYAQGRLIFWSNVDSDPKAKRTDALVTDALRNSRRIALANPALAPYGTAAQDALRHLQLYAKSQNKLVVAENIGQAFAFVYSGNADAGFLALTQWQQRPLAGGQYQLVPSSWHRPIAQDAVLLRRGQNNALAAGWLAFLDTASAREIIRADGYVLD
ncbi:MAG TPA: molybdate ABC transporter substrate-binding protein [Gammaproteobacteria bacterium]|nr:molybdate ABC transporter substrate-binding protein [Gammaproteobacteria bacterium]|tara:strand:- start:4817 stop:5731 length:915 start_codon:yes stop_codon:yes gene_type:complete